MNITDALSENGRALFSECMNRISFKKNEPVLSKGDVVSGAYIVMAGALRVFTIGDEGGQATLYRIEPGETCVLAVNSLFNDFLYPAWVEADEDTIVGVLPGSVYRTLFASEKQIQDVTIAALSSAVYGLMSSVENHFACTVEQRLANFLLLRANSECVVSNTQQEMALRIGSSREVVARVIAGWVRAEIVQSGRGKVKILDRQALADTTRNARQDVL